MLDVKYARAWQGSDEPFSAEVGRAAAALARRGDTTPLITAESGYHIARYLAERPPENVTFEQAQPMLREHDRRLDLVRNVGEHPADRIQSAPGRSDTDQVVHQCP